MACTEVCLSPAYEEGSLAVGKSGKAAWKGHLNQSRKIRNLIAPAVPAASKGSEKTCLRNIQAGEP